MKKKILCLSSAIYIFLYSTIYSFCVPVYASIPGIVEASIIWEGWETLSLILGVTTEFNNNLTISKNNDIRYEYYYNKIENDTSLSSSEKSELINQLDTCRTGFVDGVINIGSSLWTWLTRLTFEENIYTQVNLYPNLSNYQKSVFDSWSGRCAILYPEYSGSNSTSGTSKYYIFKGNIFENPVFDMNIYSDLAFYYISDSLSGNILYVSSTENNIYSNNGSYEVVVPRVGFNWQYIANKSINQSFEDTENYNSLVGSPSWREYIDGITGNFSIVDGTLIDVNTGEAPIVLDGETLDNAISDIEDGTLTYEQAIEQAFEDTDTGEITEYPSPISKKALDELIGGLNLSRLENKFPFCIPHDIQLIYSGATAVSSNAPVIIIPMHLEFKNHVYYDNDEAIVIDFSDFDGIINIFREGFFLLFLVGLLWVSIEILQAFFVVTE